MIGRIFLFTGDGPFCWDGSQVIKSGCLLYRLGEVSLFSWPIEQNAQDKQMRARRSLNLKKKRLLVGIEQFRYQSFWFQIHWRAGSGVEGGESPVVYHFRKVSGMEHDFFGRSGFRLSSFMLSRPFFGKWNWFEQTGKRRPEFCISFAWNREPATGEQFLFLSPPPRSSPNP